MGKRQGTKKENKQLWGRTALASALWHSAPQPKPYLIFVAADVNVLNHTPDAVAVKSMLTTQLEIPRDYIITRQKTNCTLLEVRAVHAICRTHKISTLFAVTHLYHAPRSQRYFNEVMPNAAVIPVHPDILDEITFPLELIDLLEKIRGIVTDSLPRSSDAIREQLVEWLLSGLHHLDSRGRLERRMARFMRPEAEK